MEMLQVVGSKGVEKWGGYNRPRCHGGLCGAMTVDFAIALQEACDG